MFSYLKNFWQDFVISVEEDKRFRMTVKKVFLENHFDSLKNALSAKQYSKKDMPVIQVFYLFENILTVLQL